MVDQFWSSFQRPNQQINSKPESPQKAQEEVQQMPTEQNIVQEDIEDPAEKVEQEEDFQWGDFQSPTTYQGEVDPQEEESMFGYVTRNIAANASRVAEQLLGSVGNFEKMGKDLLSNYPKYFGVLPWAMSEYVGPQRWERMIKGAPGMEQIAPTSAQLREASEKSTGGYTKPKSKNEARFQEYTEDIASTLLTRRIPISRGQAAINHLGVPIAANAVKDGLEASGVSENKSNIAKLGAWITLALTGNVNAPRYASDLMNRGRNAIPENINIDVPRFERALQNVANSPQLLHADPRSALARQEIAAIQRDLANGQVSTRSLMTTYDGVNAAKRDAGLFSMSANDKRFAINSINSVRDAVRDEILHSGAAFPEALNNWQSGVQAWSTIHQSQFIKNWVDNAVKSKYSKLLTGPATGLFGLGAFSGFKQPWASSVASGIGTATYKTFQTLYRVYNNPTLAAYYGRAISAAAEQNLPVFLNNYQKLNKGLGKLEPSKTKSKGKK